MEMIMTGTTLRILLQMLAQHGIGKGLGSIDHIHAGLVESNRVEGRQHTQVRNDGSIVFGVTVAVR